MKDLKHLLFFENLLRETDNELVRAAKADGRVIIGYNCAQLPEVLLNLPGCTGVRMRAPHTGLNGNWHVLHDQPHLRILPRAH